MGYDKGNNRKSGGGGGGGGYKGPRPTPVIVAAEATDKKDEVKVKVKLVNSFAGEKFVRFEFENTLVPDGVKETKGRETEFILKVPEGISSGRARASLLENPSSKNEITIDFSKIGKKTKSEEKKEENKLRVTIQRGPMMIITATTPEPKKDFTIAVGGPLEIKYVSGGGLKHGVSGDNFFVFTTDDNKSIQIVVKFKGEMVPAIFTFENETQQIPLIK